MPHALIPVGAGIATIVLGAVVLHVVRVMLARAARSAPAAAMISRRARRPAYLALVVAACHVTLPGLPAADWHTVAHQVLLLADIGIMAWGVGIALTIIIDLALLRFRTDVRDNRQARRIHTQASVLRRIGNATLAVLAVGAMLLTFPAFQGAGASVLASAGVAGVVAGFAAQSLLGNVIAGMQLAFSEALRLDDVVVVEGEWGRVEEITLVYVVVRIWDDRRLVLPTSYFLSKPFENWTRAETALLGTVEIDVDWDVPVDAMRDQLGQILKDNERWDGRTCVLQVTGATGAVVRIRALVSAADAPTLWDLRCDVREALVEWVRDNHPQALPRTRADLTIDPPRSPAEKRPPARPAVPAQNRGVALSKSTNEAADTSHNPAQP